MRYASKDELLRDIEEEHAKLLRLLGEFTAEQRDISGVWGDGWTLEDLRSWDRVRADFDERHEKIVELAEGLSEGQLLEPGHFVWTGKKPLVTYLGANTASHYRFAIKVVERWSRQRRASRER